MKQLYSARNALEAHDLRLFLAAHDIDAKVAGDNNAFEASITFTPQSAPCVFVDEAEFDRASELLVQFEDGSNSPESEVEVPVVPSSTRRTWIVWLEVVTVLALTKPLYGGHSLAGFVLTLVGLHNASTNFYLPSILYNLFAAIVVFTAIWVSGDPWSAFGIKKPTALDMLMGSIVCVVSYGFTMVGVDLFVDILESMFSERYVYQLVHTHAPQHHVQGWTGLVTLLVLSIAVGFSEELVTRGYLIPRLERLLHSTWASVLISATVFGLLHWPSGVISVFHAFLSGIVYGIAFAWTRRLWPVAMAHAAYDFSALLSHAG